MNELLPLRGAMFLLILFAAVMLALSSLISAGYARFLVPTPERTAEQFVQALAAHHYEGARQQLGEEMRRKVGDAELRALALIIDREQHGVSEAHALSARESGDSAMVTVMVKMNNGSEQVLEFPLRKQHGVWKITSIDSVLSH